MFQRRFKALVYLYLSLCTQTKDRHLGLLGFPESSLFSASPLLAFGYPSVTLSPCGLSRLHGSLGVLPRVLYSVR